MYNFHLKMHQGREREVAKDKQTQRNTYPYQEWKPHWTEPLHNQDRPKMCISWGQNLSFLLYTTCEHPLSFQTTYLALLHSWTAETQWKQNKKMFNPYFTYKEWRKKFMEKKRKILIIYKLLFHFCVQNFWYHVRFIMGQKILWSIKVKLIKAKNTLKNVNYDAFTIFYKTCLWNSYMWELN